LVAKCGAAAAADRVADDENVAFSIRRASSVSGEGFARVEL
jgi:hypothetical protein